MIIQYTLTNGQRVRERAEDRGSLEDAVSTLTLLLSGVDTAGRVSALGVPAVIGVQEIDGPRRILFTAQIIGLEFFPE